MAVPDARYETLGQLVYDHVPEEARKILLYTEFIEDGVVSASLFYELKNGELHYADCSGEIDQELFRLEELFGRDVKALEFELELADEDQRFRAHLTYADQFDAEADIVSRRDAALRKCFGHSSANYPP